MKSLALAIAVLISGCGGQVTAKPVNICLQASDKVVPMHGCDAMAMPTEERDPIKSVAIQAALPGNVVLWVGHGGEWTINNFVTLIDEAKKYPGKFTHVYLKDEANLCPTGPCPGKDDALIEQGNNIAKSAGFQTIVTLTPSVIFSPGFVLPKTDHIAIDVYWATLDRTIDFKGCKFSDNELMNHLYCSVQLLRAKGHTGKVGYMWQAFGLATDTHAYRMQYLTEQRKVIDVAGALGIDAVMAWGLHLGAYALEREPNLVPLGGTQYESLVTP